MEIGSRNCLSTYEKQQRLRKTLINSSWFIIIILCMASYIIANYTSMIEQIIFKHLANKYGYELSYSNTYSNLDTDNKEQGNYIKLTDNENNIHILFRYDENNDIEFINNLISKLTNSSIYTADSNDNDSNDNAIQSEKSIIQNIDKEFNTLNKSSLRSNKIKTGGGYNLVNIGKVLNQQNIIYESNLLESKIQSSNSEEELSLDSIFKYENSINAKLDILKSIVETESNSSNDILIIYNGSSSITDSSNDKDSTKSNSTNDKDEQAENGNKITNSLEGFVNSKEEMKEKVKDQEYNTYTELILSASKYDDTNIDSAKESLFDELLSSNSTNSTKLNNGIIIGICSNNETSIEKLNSTLNLLAIIQYLEQTILL